MIMIRSLKVRLIGLMVLVAIGPMALLGGWVAYQSGDEAAGGSAKLAAIVEQQDLQSKCVLAGREIERFFDQRKQEVITLSQAEVFRTADKAALSPYLDQAMDQLPQLKGLCVI